MRKQLLLIAILSSAILADAQTKDNRLIFDKHKAEKLIIGQWKGVNLSARCDALNGFNEMMNNLAAKTSSKAAANSMNFEFKPDKKFVSSETTRADTAKYEISDIGVDLIVKNKEKKAVKKQYKINLITKDTLIYSEEVKAKDPAFSGILELLNAETDTNKTVTITWTFHKIKKTETPGTFFKSDLANAKTNVDKIIFDKQKAEQLIIGQWKGVSISARCDALNGFNEIMNNPMSKSSLRFMALSSNYKFMLNKNLISGEGIGADTIKYEISDKGVDMISRNEENKVVRDQYKINLISEDTLIYSKEVKTSDPNFGGILKLLNAEGDTNKTVTYTYILYKIKEAKAPWTSVENDLPKNQESENLVVSNFTFFAILGGGFDNDSIFVSNDYGKHWNASFKGLPRLFGFMPSTSITVSGAKIFIGTPSGIFSSENRGQSWTKIKDIFIKEDSRHIISVASTNTSIVAFVDSIIYLSKDNGVTWSLKKIDVPGENLVDAHLSASGTQIIIEGYAVNQGFILLSTDNGNSWTDISKNLDESEYPNILSSSFIAGAYIFMNTQYGLFTSKDKGATWHTGAAGLPSSFNGNTIVENGNNIFFGSAQGVFLSLNKGESWVEVNNKELRNGVSSLAIIDSNLFALTKENKIYKASINELVNSIEK